MTETPNDQIRALVEDLDAKSDSQVTYEIEELVKQAFRAGQASCEPWMQHKETCEEHPKNRGYVGTFDMTLRRCGCGLAALRSRAGEGT